MAFRASSTGTTTYNSSTSFTIAKPAAILDGDIMLVAAASDSVHAIVGANLPTGWAQIGTTQNAPNTDSSTSVFWKVAESSDPSSFAFTGIFTAVETGLAAIASWSGRDPIAPIDSFDQSATTGTTHESDAIFPTVNDCDIVYIMGSDPPAGQSGTADTSPAATERLDAITGTNGYLFIQDYAQATAASVSLGMTLNTSDDGATFIIALAPDSGPTGYGAAGTVGAGASQSVFVEAGRAIVGTVGAGASEATSAAAYEDTGFGKVGTIGSGTSDFLDAPIPVVNNPGIQISFDDPMLEAQPTWTRIDTVVKVSRWEIRRGRQGELEKTGTAEATIYVNDVDGHFQAGNAGSPYYQKLDGRQVTISRWNPVTNTWKSRFRGTIEEYSYEYNPSQVNTEVAIKCVGFMDYLAGAEMAPGQAGVEGAVPGTIFYEAQEVDDRILALIGNAEFSTDLCIVFSGNVWVSQSTYEPGYSFLSAIHDAVDAEFPGVSNFYEDRYGRLVFHGRHARFDPDTVASEAGPVAWDFNRWSVGDGAGISIDGDAAQIRPPVSVDRSSKLIINAAMVTPLRDEGNELTNAEMEALVTRDAPSIDQHGVRSWSADDIRVLEHKTNGDNDLDQCKKIAEYYVTNYKEARDRPRQITIKPLHPSDPRAAATWALMCGVDISDIVYVYVETPGGGGIDGEFYVEGITETCRIGPPEFGFGEVTLDISPTAYYETDVFED